MSGLRTISVLTLLFTASLAHGQEKPLRQVIDEEIRKAWEQDKITPAGKSSDSVFLRRVYLDLVGVVPSYAETAQLSQGQRSAQA